MERESVVGIEADSSRESEENEITGWGERRDEMKLEAAARLPTQ